MQPAFSLLAALSDHGGSNYVAAADTSTGDVLGGLRRQLSGPASQSPSSHYVCPPSFPFLRHWVNEPRWAVWCYASESATGRRCNVETSLSVTAADGRAARWGIAGNLPACPVHLPSPIPVSESSRSVPSSSPVVSELPPLEAPPRRHNVLFFVMDDLRPDLNVGYGQTEVVSPRLDEFAGKSLTFERAYCQFAHCAPSRQSFMTGRTPQQTKVYNFESSFRDAGVGPEWVTLPEWFKQNGYYVAGGGKLFHPDSTGADIDSDPQSWTNYYYPNDPENPTFSCPSTQLYQSVCPNSSTNMDVFFDNQLADAAMNELAVAQNTGKNWFLGVGFYRPHRPWNTPVQFYNKYPNSNNMPTDMEQATHKDAPTRMPEIAWGENKWPCNQEKLGSCRCKITDQQSANYCDSGTTFTFGQTEPIPDSLALLGRWAYYASVTYVDDVFGQVVDKLEDLGMEENTVVSVIGDHGWQLGEQGQWCKRMNLELSTRVPMMIRSPSHPGSHGKKTSHFAELVDLYRTLIALAIPPDDTSVTALQEDVGGVDLAPIFENPTNPASAVKTHTFSQMSRCPRPADGLGPYSSCNSETLEEIAWMGFSVRAELYRYNIWLPFNGSDNYAAWGGDEKYEELYSYEDSDMSDFNSFERVNVVSDPDYALKRDELYLMLAREFDRKRLVSPPPPLPPAGPLLLSNPRASAGSTTFAKRVHTPAPALHTQRPIPCVSHSRLVLAVLGQGDRRQKQDLWQEQEEQEEPVVLRQGHPSVPRALSPSLALQLAPPAIH